VSVVLPCLDEAETLHACIRVAQAGLAATGLRGEVVVADNGSTDRSVQIARHCHARVVEVSERGYGSALRGGIEAARGEFVVIGDADQSYDFAAIPVLVEQLRQGHDLVMGNRFRGSIEPSAMPWSHRVIGNPLLSWLGRLFFHSRVGDFHCGLRAFRRDAILGLDLTSTGMEFASEMVVKASLQGLRVSEVPITLHRDGRSRPPHLRTWRDGWRHLRFMLLYSPRWLFLIPGATLFLVGAAVSAWVLWGSGRVGGIGLGVDTLLVAGITSLVGYQVIVFAVFTKVFVIREGLHPTHPLLTRLNRYVRLETGLLAGGVMTVSGTVILVLAFTAWASKGFGLLNPAESMRAAIPGCVLLALGVQTIFASFFLSILGVPAHENDRRGSLRTSDPADERLVGDAR
jgi:glycosyltransferase involved in cell wall biosynthesis